MIAASPEPHGAARRGPGPQPAPASVDVWQLANLPGGLRQASYLTSPEATQYRLIVDVLLDQQQVSLTGVGEDDLRDLIGARVEATAGREAATRLMESLELTARMRQLAAWGVVDDWDDRSLRPNNFLRNATRYQITSITAELARAVRRLSEDTGSSIAATFAPAVLISQLEVMAASLAADPSRAAEAWGAVKPTLDAMAEAAASWQARLASALAGAVDEQKVSALQDTLLRYIDMWGAGVDTHSDAIAAAAADLLERPTAQWRAAALDTLGADAADERVDSLVGEYLTTLITLEKWFSGPAAQARLLRRQMRDAIAPMIRGQRTLAAVGGHVSRRAELLTLAARIETANNDATGWRLWAAATGLYSTQHLAVASPQPAHGSGPVSFWDAPPAPIALRLRLQGTRALTGRPARIPDRSAGRAAARQAHAQARRAAAEMRAAMLSRSGTRLSEWAGVDAVQLETLLHMLSALVATRPGPDGSRTATTGDGLWLVRSDPAPAGQPSTVVHTPRGRLVHPDVRLYITSTSTDGPGHGPAAAGGGQAS